MTKISTYGVIAIFKNISTFAEISTLTPAPTFLRWFLWGSFILGVFFTVFVPFVGFEFFVGRHTGSPLRWARYIFLIILVWEVRGVPLPPPLSSRLPCPLSDGFLFLFINIIDKRVIKQIWLICSVHNKKIELNHLSFLCLFLFEYVHKTMKRWNFLLKIRLDFQSYNFQLTFQPIISYGIFKILCNIYQVGETYV